MYQENKIGFDAKPRQGIKSIDIHFVDDELQGENGKSYVDVAKDVIENIKKPDKYGNNIINLTTTQLRSIMAQLSEIYNKVVIVDENDLSKDLLSKLQYFRLKSIYQAGREPEVKRFIEKSSILALLEKIKTKKQFINYYHYMEALVAWHKYNYQGKD